VQALYEYALMKGGGIQGLKYIDIPHIYT
jgi:hypothetical protein